MGNFSERGQNILYRVGGNGYESALFADRDSAEYVAQIRKALYQSATLGEFRRDLPAGEWEENLEDRFDEIPPEDEPFTADDIPGHADGDYPEWLRQSQLDWFPQDLIEKYLLFPNSRDSRTCFQYVSLVRTSSSAVRIDQNSSSAKRRFARLRGSIGTPRLGY